MVYEPISIDAINAYIAAAHYRAPLITIDQPLSINVKQTSMCAFRILPTEKDDASGKRLKDEAICLYDKFTGHWLVLLQDGTIVRLHNEGTGFVVLTYIE